MLCVDLLTSAGKNETHVLIVSLGVKQKQKKSQRRIDFWAPAAPLQIVAPPPLILTYPSSGPQCVASNSAGFRKTPGGIYWEYVKDIYI